MDSKNTRVALTTVNKEVKFFDCKPKVLVDVATNTYTVCAISSRKLNHTETAKEENSSRPV